MYPAQKEKRPRQERFPKTQRAKKLYLAHESIPIFVGRQTVGQVRDDTFYKTLKGSLHLLRRPPAIAFDISTLLDAADAGAVTVEVTDSESGKVYKASVDDILRDGRRFNRGFGKQIFLPLGRWRHPNSPEQLTLFEPPEIEPTKRKATADTATFQHTQKPAKVKGGVW